MPLPRRFLPLLLLVVLALPGVGFPLCRPQTPPSPAMTPNPPATPPPAAAHAADVPVRQVVLFSSGVGFFQHEGTVRGDAETTLRFKTGQINDILKSLVLQDLDGGRAGAVTYPSQDPLEKTLGSFQINLGGNPSLGDLLNQVRGATVAVALGAENFSGTVLGVEQKTVAKDKEDRAIERPFLNVVTDRGIRSVALDDVRTLRLEDAGLQEELNKALAALAGARDQDKKPVALHFTGSGERRVRVGYVVETPIWKASYRLVLPEDGGDGKATLQGWAIVENQTDSDWNDVRLSLVSGRPISFRQDLYQSLYVPRPEVKPELYSSLKPQTYEGGQEEKAEALAGSVQLEAVPPNAARGPVMRRAAPATVMAPPGALAFSAGAPADLAAAPPPPKPFDPAQSVAAAAQTAQLGELFQYTVPAVSLPRQRSAMIPILNDPVQAERLSIYNERTLPKFALNGARVKVSTADKKALLQGPVSVFDAGSYAGDASLGDVPAGQARLLSYGVDLQLLVEPKEGRGANSLVTGKIVDGVLQVTFRRQAKKEYAAENKGEKPKRLLIEHPRRGGDEWKLVDTPAPVETLPGTYRFETTVDAGKRATFTVREETTDLQRVEILRTENLNNLLYYSRQGEIPPPVREALTKAAALQGAAAETERQMNERNAQVNAITTEQGRIRENLKTVDKGSAYATRLLKKLDDQESQIEGLRREAEALRLKLEDQRRQLGDYLKGMNVG